MKKYTMAENFQLFFAIIACILFFIVGFLRYLEPVYSRYPDASDVFSRMLVLLVEALPFLLLFIFSIMRRFTMFRRARWIPLTLLAVRCVIELTGQIASQQRIFDTLTFDTWTDYSAYTFIFILFVLAIASAIATKHSFILLGFIAAIASGHILLMEMLDFFDVLVFMWGAAYYIWLISVICLSVNLTRNNLYLRSVWFFCMRLLNGLLDDEEGDGDENYIGDYEIDEIYQNGDIIHLFIRTPEYKIVILQHCLSNDAYYVISAPKKVQDYQDYLCCDDFASADTAKDNSMPKESP